MRDLRESSPYSGVYIQTISYGPKPDTATTYIRVEVLVDADKVNELEDEIAALIEKYDVIERRGKPKVNR